MLQFINHLTVMLLSCSCCLPPSSSLLSFSRLLSSLSVHAKMFTLVPIDHITGAGFAPSRTFMMISFSTHISKISSTSVVMNIHLICDPLCVQLQKLYYYYIYNIINHSFCTNNVYVILKSISLFSKNPHIDQSVPMLAFFFHRSKLVGCYLLRLLLALLDLGQHLGPRLLDRRPWRLVVNL